MNTREKDIFSKLFNEAFEKCFGFSLNEPLSETDCKLFSNEIFEKTGLTIGAKSLKNYSFYVLKKQVAGIKEENPSKATLDTLARYVLGAPYTDEIKRKSRESHLPYWFEYSKSHLKPEQVKLKQRHVRRKASVIILSVCLLTGLLILFAYIIHSATTKRSFRDDFNSVNEDSLEKRGWIIKDKDSSWWSRRGESGGHLALYTLKGDNWPLGGNRAEIKNLLLRKVNSECYSVEIHLTDFIPGKNWQQAGILLSEDSLFTGKMIRLSFSYNSYFGGYQKPPEIIIQGLSSALSGSTSKPEEFIHQSLFQADEGNASLVKTNLSMSALKIEQIGIHFHFLYLTSGGDAFAFKEILSRDFDFHPKFAGIFSIAGWADCNPVPAYFDSFALNPLPCKR